MLIPREADLRRVAIPFRFSFRHALAERRQGDGVVLTLRDADGLVGHGECAPREYVSGETSASAIAWLMQRLPQVLGLRFESFDEVTRFVGEPSTALLREEHAAFCALELALLDLAGKSFGRSAGEPLGPVCADSVAYSGVISAGSPEAAARVCQQMKALGVTSAKVKVGGPLQDDLAVLATVREQLGDGAGLRVDANGAWDAPTALSRLQAFDTFRLEGLEQPCAAHDIDGLAWLTERSDVPVIVDESLVSLQDARRLAEARACHVFNVRISKCGGLLAAGRVRDLGRDAGIGTMLGAHVGETAILAAAGRQLAERTPDLRFAEGSYGRLLLESDVSDALDLGRGGVGAAIEGHGLGLRVDLEPIAPFVLSRRTLVARR